MTLVQIFDNMADCVTGERVFPGDIVFDTGIMNTPSPFASNGRTRILKEDTIVRLAEAAGYVVTKRDAGDSGNAKVVDGADVSVGGGEVEAGKPKVGRKPASKRRSDGDDAGK